jgi:hypothetical protein
MKSNTLRHTLQPCVVAISLLALTTGSKAATENVPGSRADGSQVCALGFPGVGQPGAIICKNATTGATTQSVAVGATVSAPGGIAGSLARHAKHVLVTNQSQGAILLEVVGGQLKSPVTLQTGVEGSLSGTLSDRGAYVLTGTRILFFPSGTMTAASSRPLLMADGSAAQVTLAGGHAYVSEKSGSLEVFSLAGDGNILGNATPVAGVPAGVIVGITGFEDLVVAPVAHLASNANQSTVPVVSGLGTAQIVPTKEVAACWAANDGGGEACITNPGSMTVSCGHLGQDAFMSYTSAAASLSGDTVFDIDMLNTLVGILGKSNGAPVLLTYGRTTMGGDFLNLIGEFSLGTATATGVVLLPPLQ